MTIDTDERESIKRSGGSVAGRVILAAVTILAVIGAYIYFRPSQVGDRPLPTAEQTAAIPDGASDLKRGLAIYAEQCAPCHGASGRGDGPAAYLLYPKPRDFTNSSFRLTSTESGLPSDDDLLRTLREGMPGSSMPPWGHLPEGDLRGLVDAVRYLAIEGRSADLEAAQKIERDEARRIAGQVLSPGPPVELPSATGTESVAHGRDLYMTACASCHDTDGRGRNKKDLKDESGLPVYARDFTQGVFKGGSEPRDLAMRIARGMPGSPMPGIEYPAQDLWSLAEFVRSLIKPGAQERAVQRQLPLVAKRIEGAIPSSPEDPRWETHTPRFIPVTPLWWRADRIEGVQFQAVHNGESVAIRLVWEDSIVDAQHAGQTAFSDGVAIQLSNRRESPPLVMGAPNGECDIWHWRASMSGPAPAISEQIAALHPYMPPAPELLAGAVTGDVFMTGPAAGNPLTKGSTSAGAFNLQAAGIGTITTQAAVGPTIEGRSRRQKSSWEVVFTRSLNPPLEGDASLQPGEATHIGIAVWDGSAGDRNGQKSFSIWHTLTLESNLP